MRPGRGCQNCKNRHVKCVLEEGTKRCARCLEKGLDCHFQSPYRFREVTQVHPQSDRGSSKDRFEWDAGHNWVQIPGSIGFVNNETGSARETSASSNAPDSTATSPPQRPSTSTTEHTFLSYDPVHSPEKPRGPTSAHQPLPTALPQLQPIPITGPSPPTIDARDPGFHSSPASRGNVAIANLISPNASITSPFLPTSSPQNHHGSYRGARSQDISQGLMTKREAYLLRTWVSRLAPWCDACDSFSHFGSEVPKRALSNPLLLYSILALSSRYEALCTGTDELEASYYHGQCLKLLISALSDPKHQDENLLAAVTISRFYEEMNSLEDMETHLLGSSRLLNSDAKFASSGGLAEAAAWWSLRQAIYISMVQRQPLDIGLENFEASSVFFRQDDAACANVMVYLVAKVLKVLVHPSNGSYPGIDVWETLNDEVETWYHSRPQTFQPILYEPVDIAQGRPFPEIWLMASPQVIGLQHYFCARIFLTLHKPQLGPNVGFHAAKARRDDEKAVASNLATILGLAISNKTVENANFLGAHMLSVCGYCIRDPVQQKHALEFLEMFEKVMAFRISSTVESLKMQWRDLDE